MRFDLIVVIFPNIGVLFIVSVFSRANRKRKDTLCSSCEKRRVGENKSLSYLSFSIKI